MSGTTPSTSGMTSKRQTTRSVIVISSINEDTRVEVERLPWKGETIHAKSITTGLGGKGANVAIAAARNKQPVYLVGAIGTDGQAHLETLQHAKVNTEHISVCKDSRTGRAIVTVDAHGENHIIVHAGANTQVSPHVPTALCDTVDNAVVILHLELPMVTCVHLARRARAAGALIVLNISPVTDWRAAREALQAAHVLVVNEGEALAIAGWTRSTSPNVDADADADAEGSGRGKWWGRLFERVVKEGCGGGETVEAVVVTLGERGVVYLRNGVVRFVEATTARAVRDSTAAGDTWLGFFAAGMASGWEFDKCVRVGGAAAALCVEKEGAADSIPTWDEVSQRMREPH